MQWSGRGVGLGGDGPLWGAPLGGVETCLHGSSPQPFVKRDGEGHAPPPGLGWVVFCTSAIYIAGVPRPWPFQKLPLGEVLSEKVSTWGGWCFVGGPVEC